MEREGRRFGLVWGLGEVVNGSFNLLSGQHLNKTKSPRGGGGIEDGEERKKRRGEVEYTPMTRWNT